MHNDDFYNTNRSNTQNKAILKTIFDSKATCQRPSQTPSKPNQTYTFCSKQTHPHLIKAIVIHAKLHLANVTGVFLAQTIIKQVFHVCYLYILYRGFWTGCSVILVHLTVCFYCHLVALQSAFRLFPHSDTANSNCPTNPSAYLHSSYKPVLCWFSSNVLLFLTVFFSSF